MLDEKYEIDFPESETLNWKTVMFNCPNKPYYHKKKVTGVLLHDGNFVINGMLFNAGEFDVIDEDPIGTLFGNKN